MSTFTASLHSDLKSSPSGLIAASSKITVGVTGTASSVFLLAKVPNGANIVDFIWVVDDAASDQEYDLGIQKPEGSVSGSVTLSQSALAADQSISNLTTALRPQFGLKLPYKVSISDAAVPRWAWVAAVNQVAISASANMTFTVFYTMDDRDA